MKIFIEGSALLKERSGIGQYTKRLIQGMVQTHPENSYTIFGFKFWTRPLPPNIFPENLKIKYRIVRFMPGRAYNLLFKKGVRLPIDVLLRRRPHIVFFPNFVAWPLLSRKSKIVLAVHDLSFIYYSQYTHPKNLPYMLKYVPYSIKRADHIITISKSSKQQIIDHYKIPGKKITVITPALDHTQYHPRTAKEIVTVRKKYKLPDKYVLYAGTLEPRKNIEGILQAYSQLDENIRKIYGLVLAGGRGWLDEPIHQTIKQLQAAGENIITTGYVPDEDLPAIFSGSVLFVFPSFYEGFGIPPLEAMACGVPVITADNSSLPEAVGDAAIMVRAEDTKAITQAMTKVLTNKKLAEQLRVKGFDQAQKFSWENSAQSTIELFEKLTSR